MPSISRNSNSSNSKMCSPKAVIIKIISIRHITINLISNHSTKHSRNIAISHKLSNLLAILSQLLRLKMKCHMMAPINIATLLPMELRLTKEDIWRISEQAKLRLSKVHTNIHHLKAFQFLFTTLLMNMALRYAFNYYWLKDSKEIINRPVEIICQLLHQSLKQLRNPFNWSLEHNQHLLHMDGKTNKIKQVDGSNPININSNNNKSINNNGNLKTNKTNKNGIKIYYKLTAQRTMNSITKKWIVNNLFKYFNKKQQIVGEKKTKVKKIICIILKTLFLIQSH